MKLKSVEVDILYYIEKNDLMVQCPQLGLYGIAGKTISNIPPETDCIVKGLKNKLDSAVSRFERPADFVNSLLAHGHWYKDPKGVPQPKELDYFLTKFSYLGNTMKRSNVKTFKHSLDIYMP